MTFVHQLFGFLVAAAYLPWLPQSGNELRWSIIGIGAALMTFEDRRKVEFTRPVIAFALLFAWGTLSLTWAAVLSLSFARWIEWWFLALVFYHGVTSYRYDDVLRGMVLGVAVSGVLVPLQLLGFDLIAQWSSPAGFFYSKLALVEVAVPLLFICIARGWWWSALFCASAAILPSSRGAWLATMAGSSPLVIARWPRCRWYLIVGLIALLIALLPIFISLSPNTWNHRGDIWGWTIENLTQFGHGLGSYPIVFGAAHAHNDFLEVTYELGWFGLVFFVAALALLPRDGEEWPAIFSILVLSLASFPLQNPASSFLFALLAGRLASRGVRVWVSDDDLRDEDGDRYPFGSRDAFGYPRR